MDGDRLLLITRDPVRAWRAHAAAVGWAPPPPGATVFVSSRRAARTFGLAGPVTTLERWARTPPAAVATPLARRRALLAAIAVEGAAAGGAEAAPGVTRPEDAAGHALIAAPAVRELLRVADLDAPPMPLDAPLARWWRVARRYRALLAEQGTLDPAEVLRIAAARARAAGAVARGPVAVLGHLDLRPDEVEAIDAVAGLGSVVVLPHDPPWTDANDAARAALRARGWRERLDPGAAPQPVLVALRPPTLEAEARWAVAEAKRLLREGLPADEIALTCRDPAAYAAPLRAAATAAGVPLVVDRWLPLAATRAAAPVMAWLEAVAQRGAFEPTLAWLAHPRVARLAADEVDALRRWRPGDARAWRRVDREAAAALDWPASDTAAGWRDRLAAGWRGIGVTPRADPATLASAGASAGASADAPTDPPTDAPAAADPPDGRAPDPFAHPPLTAVWREALASLPEPPDGEARLPREAVVATLREALRAYTVRDEPTAAGPRDDVLVLRPLEGVADGRFAQVLLLGAVEGGLPAPTPDDPILGFRERAALAAAGLPLATAAQLARAETLRFWGAWRAAGARLWLGVPAQTGGDPRLPSPFLARLGVAPAEVGEPPPASPQAFRALALRARDAVPDGVDPVLARARRAYDQALARELAPTWGPDDGFVGVGVDPDAMLWSATQLTDLGTCRFRWWVTRVWGVAPPQEGPTELTPLIEGRLYHAALDGALRAAIGLAGPAARAAADAALDDAFTRAEREEGIADQVPHWARRRTDHLAHLRGLLANPAFLPDDHEVLASERRFTGSWHGWRVAGRVDRVDRTPAGVRLIDYKLGGGRPLGARDAELEPTLDLQLPLYQEVAAPQIVPGEPVAAAVYLSLRKMGEVKAQPPLPAELEDLFTRLRASLRAGFFPVEPHDDVCRRCDLELVCRKGPHLERKPPTYRVPLSPEGGP